ncbi:DHA1 family bicyclomycin/chloramphenicol resistance-like MFS transporter [Flavobacterium arsenatis]|uniref:DHA1 family bicyclomycin/chloramphenicol resistance-like MFS transporter n=1 Tax=Flavobacterium arsenatis TaxID=1484332 RepID=A0ABU1TN18_9FLAO|nr:multidrug effflux MFS transporter [Flavobacterium arsenatis]MDR6967359.1 DHA1 family bicyclomycin/chloramphenicol resistance-like MFS transporter [Flavobacterium arsenatis]
MEKQKNFWLILVLGSLTAIGPFSIDMYLPGFSAIAKDLNTTVNNVSLSLSSYFIGISAGQLLYGPLLDRFGRKKPLYIGLLVYIIASLCCVFVTDIDSFIVLRFIQAVGSCAASVAAMTMVRDLFPVKETPKVFAKLMLVLGLSPMLAPTIGGYVTADFGWHAVFIILTLMGVAILAAVKFALPSNYKPDTSISLKPKPIISNFLMVLKEPQFYTYAFTGAVAFAGLFTYVAGSPMIFMDIYKVDGKTYGWIFALLSVSFIGSSQLNSILLRKYTSEQLVRVALISQSIISVFFLVGVMNDVFNLYGIIAMFFLFLSCLGLASPNTAGLSLAPFAKNAGSASALMGAVQMILGSVASVAVGLFVKDSMTPITVILLASSTLALLILTVGKRNIKKMQDSEQFID